MHEIFQNLTLEICIRGTYCAHPYQKKVEGETCHTYRSQFLVHICNDSPASSIRTIPYTGRQYALDGTRYKCMGILPIGDGPLPDDHRHHHVVRPPTIFGVSSRSKLDTEYKYCSVAPFTMIVTFFNQVYIYTRVPKSRPLLTRQYIKQQHCQTHQHRSTHYNTTIYS